MKYNISLIQRVYKNVGCIFEEGSMNEFLIHKMKNIFIGYSEIPYISNLFLHAFFVHSKESIQKLNFCYCFIKIYRHIFIDNLQKQQQQQQKSFK